MTNINVEGLSKNGSDFRRHVNVSEYQVKKDYYRHSLVYMKLTVTTNQETTRDTQKIKRKKSNAILHHARKVITMQEKRANV